jgi:ribosome-binding ATPase YchF (GTP1/OBG family)
MATPEQKRFKKRLEQLKRMTAKQTAAAMNAASAALDQSQQEIAALKRIIISERAQVIYYTEKYEAFIQHKCLDLQPLGFLDLAEEVKETFIKRAIKELSGDEVTPHSGSTIIQ